MSRPRRVLRACAIFVALALTVAACGSKDNKSKQSVGTNLGTTTTTTGGDASATTLEGASTTARSGTAGSTGAKTGSAGSTGDVRNVVAVAPGKYNYETKGTSRANGTIKGAPLDSSKKIDSKWDATYLASKGSVQHADFTGSTAYMAQDLTYASGNGADFTYLHYNNGGDKLEFRPDPPARFVPMPAALGATWSYSMTSQPNANTGKITTRKGDFRVDRTETLRINGKDVKCVVIVATIVMDQPLVKTSKVTSWYSEDYKLMVKEHEIYDEDVNDDPSNTHIHIHGDVTTNISQVTPG